jgi:hypothetical protein
VEAGLAPAGCAAILLAVGFIGKGSAGILPATTGFQPVGGSACAICRKTWNRRDVFSVRQDAGQCGLEARAPLCHAERYGGAATQAHFFKKEERGLSNGRRAVILC